MTGTYLPDSMVSLIAQGSTYLGESFPVLMQFLVNFHSLYHWINILKLCFVCQVSLFRCEWCSTFCAIGAHCFTNFFELEEFSTENILLILTILFQDSKGEDCVNEWFDWCQIEDHRVLVCGRLSFSQIHYILYHLWVAYRIGWKLVE